MLIVQYGFFVLNGNIRMKNVAYYNILVYLINI